MNKILDVLIPTYNRSEFLLKNLNHLQGEILKYQLTEVIRLIISDNCSSDDTEVKVKEFIKLSPLEIVYNRQETNLGLEPNMVSILSKASAPFVMWIGDDDFLAKGYLKYCLNRINEIDNIGLIIPGLSSLFEDGSVEQGRLERFDEVVLNPEFESAWAYSHLSHQMSGLVMRREELLEGYLAKPKYRNPYLFIQLTTNRMLQYQSVYAPKFKTLVAVFNDKDWGYNQVGLLDEVFKSYLAFLGQISEQQVMKLLIRFSVLHSYRYNIRWYRPVSLIKKYFHLVHQTPTLSGFRSELAKHLVKDYLLSFFR